MSHTFLVYIPEKHNIGIHSPYWKEYIFSLHLTIDFDIPFGHMTTKWCHFPIVSCRDEKLCPFPCCRLEGTIVVYQLLTIQKVDRSSWEDVNIFIDFIKTKVNSRKSSHCHVQALRDTEGESDNIDIGKLPHCDHLVVGRWNLANKSAGIESAPWKALDWRIF